MSLFIELFNQCNVGDRAACERLYFTYYLLPRLSHELKKFLQVPDLVIVPIPQPDPPPFITLDVSRLESNFSRLLLGDPDPEPSKLSPIDQLQGAILFRESLMNTVAFVDGEIKRLQQEKCS